jgi:hypothetical protein
MTIKKFAGIVDNDVFTVVTIDTERQGVNAERLIAGLSSNPIFVEIPSELDVDISWTWNGTQFVEG